MVSIILGSSYHADIDQFEVDVTVMSVAAAHALLWQKNTHNKWREMGKIHGIIEKNHYCCAFGYQNRNANHFFRIPLSKTKETHV